MAEPLLQAVGLGHRFGPSDWLFRSVDLSIASGDRVAILGPNGRGKSTLLELLVNARRPLEGFVSRSGRVAFVPQAFIPAFAFSALDIVLTGRTRRVALFGQPSKADEEAALHALAELDMAWAAERTFDTLSGGEQQLVLLARAVAAEADLMILDEPTATLDLAHQRQVLKWIGRLATAGRALVFTTHDPTQALHAADRVLLLLGAHEHRLGASDTELTEANLSRLYNTPIHATFTKQRDRIASFVATD